MPPEAFRGLPPTSAMDIWAFGITLIELLTAEYPHGELEDDEIARLVGWTGEHPAVPENVSPVCRFITGFVTGFDMVQN